ncbi:MAG: DUF2256 and DUF3253 domain-containing protein [Verrucomicrobiae bacterium]|nr:DUF2256 and DUF3253 domain-containing protein [Verrucomicrobiae bacterium]
METVKHCESCGRRIEWRKKWAAAWNQVRYCSDACRRNKPRGKDLELEREILALLEARPRNATICPSEAARAVFPETWRDRMEDTRRAARRLAARGRVEVTQRGAPVDPSTAKGPIRLRKTHNADTR